MGWPGKIKKHVALGQPLIKFVPAPPLSRRPTPPLCVLVTSVSHELPLFAVSCELLCASFFPVSFAVKSVRGSHLTLQCKPQPPDRSTGSQNVKVPSQSTQLPALVWCTRALAGRRAPHPHPPFEIPPVHDCEINITSKTCPAVSPCYSLLPEQRLT